MRYGHLFAFVVSFTLFASSSRAETFSAGEAIQTMKTFFGGERDYLLLHGTSTEGEPCTGDFSFASIVDDTYAGIGLKVGAGDDYSEVLMAMSDLFETKDLKVDEARGTFEVTSIQERDVWNIPSTKRKMTIRVQRTPEAYRVYLRERFQRGFSRDTYEAECTFAR